MAAVGLGSIGRRVVTVALVMSLAACSSSSSSSTAVNSTDGSAQPGGALSGGSVGDLTAAGIQVIADENALTTPASPLVLTRVQADRLLADVSPDDGWLGADLDALAPLPDGTPPLAFIVGAWVSRGGTDAAHLASKWMGEQDWTRSDQVQFPNAVLALFANDIAAMVQTDAAGTTDDSMQFELGALGGSLGSSRLPDRPLPQVDGGPCSTVQNFINSAFASLINALHITPPGGTGIFADIGRGLVFILNAATQLAADFLHGLVNTITEPVFNVIKIAVATAGLVTIIGSYLSDTHLNIKLVPGQGQQKYRFAVGSEADIRGEFVASGPNLTGQWPQALLDCAASTGASLPKAIGAGSDAKWRVVDRPELIVTDSLDTKVKDDLTARLGFATGRESEETAKGEETQANSFVEVTIPRKDVQDLAQMGKDLIDQALQALANQLVLPGVKDIALAALREVVKPLVAQLDSALQGIGVQLLGLTAKHFVNVTFHNPPSTTTTSAPDTTTVPSTDPKDSEFCIRMKDMADYMQAHDIPITLDEWHAYGAELVRRTQGLIDVAPPQFLPDLEKLMTLYTSVRDSVDHTATGLLGFSLSPAMGKYCGLI